MKRLLVSLTTIAISGCLVGCATTAAFTPAQVQSIRDVGMAVADVAARAGVTAQAEVELMPLEAQLVQGVRVSGLHARIIVTANPAAQKEP